MNQLIKNEIIMIQREFE